MTPPDATHLEEWFVRYWDNALTERELARLAALLRSDPTARGHFRMLCLQAAAAADQAPLASRSARSQRTVASPTTRNRKIWSRRRALQYLGAGVLTGLAGGVIGHQVVSDAEAAIAARVVATRGLVTLRDVMGQAIPVGEIIPPGGMVTTRGLDASAELAYSDGTDVLLSGDTAITVGGNGSSLLLHRGAALADVRPRIATRSEPFTLMTAVARLISPSGAVMTLGHASHETEIGVRHGQVAVVDPTGEPLGIVQNGELLTLAAGGRSRRELLSTTPDVFALNLNQPLPNDWHVGFREETTDGPVLCPEFWPDPYHRNIEMYQIRSDQRWTRGFFRLHPDSRLRIRYRVEQPGAGQVTVCVRTDRSKWEYAGVLEWNGVFGHHGRLGDWQWLDVRADSMLDNIHAPSVGPPWVSFLLIFNTYTTDLGLRVAEYRVSRPG